LSGAAVVTAGDLSSVDWCRVSSVEPSHLW